MNVVRLAAPLCAALLTGACASHRPAEPLSPVVRLDPEDRRLVAVRRESDSLQVVIASLAVFKASDPDVRRLAQTIVRDHMQSMNETTALGGARRGFRPAAFRREGLEPTVARFARMQPGPAFDQAFVEAVLAAHRHDQDERQRLLPRIGEALRGLLERTQPMLDLHLRLAEAVRRGSQ